ncbi:hypothetical protein V6N13_013952 [Hibiscus sabdariffa]
MNHRLVNGKMIRVAWSLRDPHARKSGVGNVFVKNLSETIKSVGFQDLFQKFGNVISCKVATFEDGKSKGYGFVQFGSEESAIAAIEKLDNTMIGDKQVLSNVYVKNIDDDVTDDELRDLFGRCGTVTSAKLMRDDKGINNGFGFVCFSAPEEAAKAVSMFHNKLMRYLFHRKPLYVAIAQRKEDRRAQLQLQFAQHLAGLAGPSIAILPGGYHQLYISDWHCFTSTSEAGDDVPAFKFKARMVGANRARMNSHETIDQTKYVRNGRARELKNGSDATPAGSNSVSALTQGTEMMSSMLAAASPKQQKTILGERLYEYRTLILPKLIYFSCVQPDLALKITGMLLEMDNSQV